MCPCHIVFDSSLCLLCNIMFKSSSVEGHQLKKTAKTKAPIYTGLPHSNTVFYPLKVKLCSNEIM